MLPSMSHPVRASTIGRRLHDTGPHACRPLQRLSLTPRQRHQRLQWCCARLSRSDSEWQRVIFSNESHFSLGEDNQQIYVWRPEILVSLHLHSYPTTCRNCVRIFKLHGMDHRRTPLGTSTSPFRVVSSNCYFPSQSHTTLPSGCS